MALTIKVNEETFTPRQQAVLTAALDLLVENGDGLTMTAVARRASGFDTHTKRTSPSWANQSGDGHGRPSASAVASVM